MSFNINHVQICLGLKLTIKTECILSCNNVMCVVLYVVGSKFFRTDVTEAAPNGKCCEGYKVPSMVTLMYQLKSVLK